MEIQLLQQGILHCYVLRCKKLSIVQATATGVLTLLANPACGRWSVNTYALNALVYVECTVLMYKYAPTAQQHVCLNPIATMSIVYSLKEMHNFPSMFE